MSATEDRRELATLPLKSLRELEALHQRYLRDVNEELRHIADLKAQALQRRDGIATELSLVKGAISDVLHQGETITVKGEML